MENNYENSSIEVLGLDTGIVKKLKQIFIYTVGQLQVKTEVALKESLIFQEESWGIMTISNVLVKKTGRGLAEEIEPQDRIENIRKGIRNFRVLKRYGLCRISELMRISEEELKTIKGIDYATYEKIQEALRNHYGEQYETIKKQIIGENPEAISLGHLNVSGTLYRNFIEGEIYTIGDYQRRSDAELVSIARMDIFDIKSVNKQLATHGFDRYKKGEERIEILDLPLEMQKAHESEGIERVDQLLEMTFEKMRSMYQDDDEAIIRIFEAYIENITFRNRQVNQGIMLIILRRIRTVMENIKQDQELEKKKIKEIIEMLEVSEK